MTQKMCPAARTGKFFVRHATASNTRSCPGGLVTFLVSSGETENRFCLFEAQMQPGNEPPLHFHEERDVVFYVLEGEMDVYCGTEVRTARTGETVFLPRLLPQTYRVLSPIVRFLALVQPGNGKAIAIQADAADADAVKAAVEKTVATFGRLDVPVNDAGTAIPKTFEEVTKNG